LSGGQNIPANKKRRGVWGYNICGEGKKGMSQLGKKMRKKKHTIGGVSRAMLN